LRRRSLGCGKGAFETLYEGTIRRTESPSQPTAGGAKAAQFALNGANCVHYINVLYSFLGVDLAEFVVHLFRLLRDIVDFRV